MSQSDMRSSECEVQFFSVECKVQCDCWTPKFPVNEGTLTFKQPFAIRHSMPFWLGISLALPFSPS